MAYSFGDGFDAYATTADLSQGYWDSVVPNNTFISSGRFTTSRSFQFGFGSSITKISNVNDAVHHFAVAILQNSGISGTGVTYIQLLDGTTNQCCISFRTDGAIVLTSGAYSGTVLATYVNAYNSQAVWFHFEIEVVISNTAGRMRVRKNGSPTDDYDSGATLNTRGGTANNYANRVTLGMPNNYDFRMDDFFWKSDASSVPWMGDMRCYTRMPASDASVQFSKTPTNYFAQTSTSVTNTSAITPGIIRATSVTAPNTGTLVSLTFNISTAYTGRVKMALYDTSTAPGGGPGNLLATSAELTNPGAGVTVFSVTAGPVLTRGVVYWVALWHDGSLTGVGSPSLACAIVTLAYAASFPATMAGWSSTNYTAMGSSGMNIVPSNAALVSEAQQDNISSFVYDGTVGHADFYNLATIPSVPVSTIAVTTRGFMQKSDAGARTTAMQIKSGATTVATPTLNPGSNFLWTYRTDTVDPATGAAWTAAAVDAAQIGPVVVS
jgi:hypothetical protein